MPPDFSDKPSAIRNYNHASPCPLTFDGNIGAERFRTCSDCEHYIYEFSGLSLYDSKQIVFKREGKANPTFYRREDGTFTTVDCPKSPAKQIQKCLILAVDVAVGFLVLSPAIFAVTNKTDTNANPYAGPEIAELAKAKGKLGVGSINSFGVLQRHRPQTIRLVSNASSSSSSSSSSALSSSSSAASAHAGMMPLRTAPGAPSGGNSGISVSNTDPSANTEFAPAIVPTGVPASPPREPKWSGYFGQSRSSAQPAPDPGGVPSGSDASAGTAKRANVRSY